MLVFTLRAVAVGHRPGEFEQTIGEAGRGVDELGGWEGRPLHPLGVAGPVEEDEIRLLIGGDGFGVRRPESWVFIGGRREDHLDLVTAESFGEIGEGLVHGVDNQTIRGFFGQRRGWFGNGPSAGCKDDQKRKGK